MGNMALLLYWPTKAGKFPVQLQASGVCVAVKTLTVTER